MDKKFYKEVLEAAYIKTAKDLTEANKELKKLKKNGNEEEVKDVMHEIEKLREFKKKIAMEVMGL